MMGRPTPAEAANTRCINAWEVITQDHSAGPARVFHPKRAVVCTDAKSSTSFYESAVTQFVWMLPRFFVQFTQVAKDMNRQTRDVR